MNIWHDISKERITKTDFIGVVEIPKRGEVKYELDKETGMLKLDRVLYTSTHYPTNYGFIPRTYAEDNDPLDVLILCNEQIVPLTLVECYPIGVLIMNDSGEEDEKIIAISKRDPYLNVYNDISASFDLPEMEPGDHNDNNTVVDLSKNGTANCYIVPSAGTYKFNASVQGNSLDPVGNITEADVVWETLNTPESISVGDVINSVSLSDDGYVIFDATGTYGNALIAVKDKNGTILWSWHIWVTDYNPDEDYDVYVGKENYKIMDRNLGALSNTPGDSRALGLIYQWGRKEPFMNKNYISTDDNLQFITSNNEYGTVEYAIQHPLTYICGHTSFVLDWYDDTPNNTLWSETKSKYDPSPVGWKVPSEDVWANFPNDNTGYDATNKGKLIDERYSNPPTWIPLDNDGREAWQGDWQSENATTFWTTKTGSGSFVYVSRISNDSHSYFAHYRAVAISIRCVKE